MRLLGYGHASMVLVGRLPRRWKRGLTARCWPRWRAFHCTPSPIVDHINEAALNACAAKSPSRQSPPTASPSMTTAALCTVTNSRSEMGRPTWYWSRWTLLTASGREQLLAHSDSGTKRVPLCAVYRKSGSDRAYDAQPAYTYTCPRNILKSAPEPAKTRYPHRGGGSNAVRGVYGGSELNQRIDREQSRKQKKPQDMGLCFQCLTSLSGGERGIRTLDGPFKPILP